MREGLSRRGLALVLAALCLPVFYGLGRLDLENDEAIYAYAVDSMLSTGDWLNPRSSPSPDTIFLEKPPLKFWIVAAPIRLGLLPHDEFGLRFWDAVMAVVAMVYVAAIGRRLGGSLCGLTAVLFLLGYGPLWFDHGLRGNYMEAPLFLCYAAAAWHFLAWLDAATPRAHRWHVAAVATAFLLGFLTKFVAALFLPPVLLLTALALPNARTRLREDLGLWFTAAAAIVIAAAPWFVYQQVHSGRQLWQTILGEHVVTRFTASLDPAHVHPWHYYLTTIAWHLDFRGFAALTVIGLALVFHAAVRRRSAAAVLVLVWLALPLAAISLGTSKLHHYAYPFLPPLALAAGVTVEAGLRLAGPIAVRLIESARLWLYGSGWRPRAGLALVAAVMVAAGVLALQSTVSGHVTWRIAGVNLLRNANVSPPLAALLLGLALVGAVGSRPAIAVVVLLLVFGRWYEETLHRFAWQVHPLRTARACLAGVEGPGAGQAAVLAVRQDTWFLHPDFYYLSAPSGWERVESVDAPQVRDALVDEARPRPVIVGDDDYARLAAEHLIAGSGELRLDRGRVLLPGRFAVCGMPAVGGR